MNSLFALFMRQTNSGMIVRAICYLLFSILFITLALRARAIKKNGTKSHIALHAFPQASIYFGKLKILTKVYNFSTSLR